MSIFFLELYVTWCISSHGTIFHFVSIFFLDLCVSLYLSLYWYKMSVRVYLFLRTICKFPFIIFLGSYVTSSISLLGTIYPFVSIFFMELYVSSCLYSSWNHMSARVYPLRGNNLSVRVFRHLRTMCQFVSVFFFVICAKYVYRKFVVYPGFVIKYLVSLLLWH